MSDLESIKGPESFQVLERPRSTLTNYKNLAYNILKNLNDELVKDKEISELRLCSECTMKVLALPLKSQSDYNTLIRNSQSSQSSRTSAISNLMSEKFVLNSPVILEDLIEKVVKNALIQESEIGTCAKYSEKITSGFPKDTIFLFCKHAVHFDCIDNPNKRCPTCPVNLQLFLTTQ
ncbi:unnamed protein product [Rhizophagus irregularis]|uniref:RING-type domain-containing protein n=1 Tax=Rhizophagus irregularis TaxID=588596 RepID=A0A2N1NK11_9GLOM|nr:hypothetical protein RhiirC2_774949 [Rhizophagus irregularis]CAB4390951.1 unnamed protein product [Rhizophagus irregularis]